MNPVRFAPIRKATARRCSRPCAGRWDGARCVRCVERGRTRSFTTGDCGPVAQCRGRRGAGDGDEDLHPRGHGGDDATCLWTRPSYHRDRPRPSRAAPARRSVRSRSVVLLTQTRVGAWARGDARSLSPSPSRVLLAEGRRGHGNATAVRSQSEPAADEDRRAANDVFFV